MKSSSSRGGGLSRFGSNTIENDGGTKLVGKIEEIKAAPSSGRKRLVVKEDGKQHSRSYIDIDVKQSKDLEKNQKYVFDVKDKETTTYGRRNRKPYSAFNAYDCDRAPDDYDSSAGSSERSTRFGGSSRLSKGKRTRF